MPQIHHGIQKLRARTCKLLRWIEGEPETDMIFRYTVTSERLDAAIAAVDAAIAALEVKQ
jgi:hypothetical protein